MATTNVLLTTFAGCASLPTSPKTICIPLPSDTTTETLFSHLSSLLPDSLPLARLVLTTTSNRRIVPSRTTTLASLLSSPHPHNNHHHEPSPPPLPLPLRLTTTLPGGKGGFGSQLRAAGGRMSSRKKRNAEAQNGSSRNLDGRRLRTITEAKNLATYLATKPEMERREKEERRKRWEAVVEAAERREEEVRRGGGGGRGKGLSEEWVTEKEEVGEGVRDAVRRAMMGGGGGVSVDGGEDVGTGKARDEHGPVLASRREGGSGSRSGSHSASGASKDASEDDSDDAANDDDDDDPMELDAEDVQKLQAEAAAGDADAIWVLNNHRGLVATTSSNTTKKTKQPQRRRYVGFDDDDDDEVSSSEDADEEDDMRTSLGKGKGKGKGKA